MDTPRSTYPAFSRADRRRLSQALAQAQDARLYRRLQAVAEIAAGEPVDVVAKRARVGRSTVYRWIERYLAEQAPSALADERRSGRPRTASVLQTRSSANSSRATHTGLAMTPTPGPCHCWPHICTHRAS